MPRLRVATGGIIHCANTVATGA
eukprot:COSAG02_NODE_43925_length_370_cov_0.952030_1_plen_22_part_01